MYYYNGNRYDGNWKNDKKEGKGIFYDSNGNIYEGVWINGLYSGFNDVQK